MKPATELGAARVAITGAALAIIGATIVADHSVAGHAALVCGTLLFAAGARLPGRERERAAGTHGSRSSTFGLGLSALATAASVLSAGDRLVLALWTAGLAAMLVSPLLAAWNEAERPRATGLLALALVAVSSALVNLVRLTEFPWAVHGDLGEIALHALDMNVSRDVFRPSAWFSLPGVFLAVQRLGLGVHDGLYGARLSDAVVGVLATVFVYATVCELAGRRTALVTAILAVGSASLINTWRSGLGLAPPILLPLVASWAFLRARGSPRSRDFFLLAGVAAGLSVQVYVPARIVPFLLTAWAVHELVFASHDDRRRILAGYAWTVLAAVLVAGPLLVHYVSHLDSVLPLSERTLFGREGLAHSLQIYGAPSLPGLLWNQGIRALGMFHFYPSGDGGSFLPNRGGFFEPLTAALYWLGVAAAVVRPSERRSAWPLLGCLIALSLEFLTVDPPSYSRGGPAAAMALLLVGIGSAALLTAVERVVAGAGLDRTVSTSGAGRRVAQVAAVGLGCAGLAWGTSRYFLEYCQKDWPLSSSTAVARRIAAEPREGTFTYLMTVPVFSFSYGNIRFVASGHRGVDLRPGAPPPRELAPGVNLFIAAPGRADELRALARELPPGRWEEHHKMGPNRELQMLVRRIATTGNATATR